MNKLILFLFLISFLVSCGDDLVVNNLSKPKEEIKDKEEEKKEEEEKPKEEKKEEEDTNPTFGGQTPLKEIDLSFWSTYGKNDANESNIVDESYLKINDIWKYDDETMEDTQIREVLIWDKINVEYVRKYGGRELVRGEAFAFTPMLNISGKPFHGYIKMSLWQNGKLVEQYPAKELKQTTEFPYHQVPYICLIEAPAGDYELRVLIREHGSDKWVIPPYAREYNKKEHWLFTVKEKPDVPAVKLFEAEYTEGKKLGSKREMISAGETSTSVIEESKPFTVKYELVNNGNTPLKGEVKLVWERVFDGTMYEKEQADWILSLYRGHFSDEDITRSWSDEIGKTSVEIDPKRKIEVEKMYRIGRTRLFGANSFGTLRLYFKAENSNEWVLIRAYLNENLENKDINVINKPDFGGNYISFCTTENIKQINDYRNNINNK